MRFPPANPGTLPSKLSPRSDQEATDSSRARDAPAPEVYPRFWAVGFEGLVGGAGGYACVGNRVLVDERMPREHVEVLTTLWEDLDAFYIWQGPDQMGPSEGYLDFFRPPRGQASRDWIEYAQSITPFIVDIDGGAFTKVTAYVPPEKASMNG